jgi:hypothetical protein
MAFSSRHLVAAGAMAGALVIGGATWAAAQDSPSTTGDGSTTTTTEQDNRSDEQAPRSREGCRHGGDPSERDGSDDGSSGSGDAEASVFWS